MTDFDVTSQNKLQEKLNLLQTPVLVVKWQKKKNNQPNKQPHSFIMRQP